MSIRELLARHQRGLPLAGKQPIFGVSDQDSEADQFGMPINTLQTLDLAEREALQDSLRADIQRLKTAAIAEKQEADKVKAEKQKQDEDLQMQKIRNMFDEHMKKGSQQAANQV